MKLRRKLLLLFKKFKTNERLFDLVKKFANTGKNTKEWNPQKSFPHLCNTRR